MAEKGVEEQVLAMERLRKVASAYQSLTEEVLADE